MDIRGQRTWCKDCTAPIVLSDNVTIVTLFLEALPAYHCGQGFFGSVAVEGFDRTAILSLMELHCIAVNERVELWSALSELEDEYRRIRALKNKTETKADKEKKHGA